MFVNGYRVDKNKIHGEIDHWKLNKIERQATGSDRLCKQYILQTERKHMIWFSEQHVIMIYLGMKNEPHNDFP